MSDLFRMMDEAITHDAHNRKPWEQAQVDRWRAVHGFPAWLTDAEIWLTWLEMSGFGSAEEDEAACIDYLKHEVIRLEALRG